MARGRKSKQKRSRPRKVKRTRSKSVPLGVKVGATVAVVPPVLFPGLDALHPLISGDPAFGQMTITGRLAAAGASFIDSFTDGFGLGRPVSSIRVGLVTGGSFIYNTSSALPPGVFLKTTAAGLALALTTGIQSWLARKAAGVKQVRVMNRRIA